MVNAVTDIQEDTMVEIVLSTAQLGDDDIGKFVYIFLVYFFYLNKFLFTIFSEIKPHSLMVHSYKTPTFCNFCGEMLFGMFKQGLKCENCGLNFHKRCVFKIPNDCSHSRKKRRSSFVGTISGSSIALSASTSVGATSYDGMISFFFKVSWKFFQRYLVTNFFFLHVLGNFLLPPSTDGSSMSPGTTRKEQRSTSMMG